MNISWLEPLVTVGSLLGTVVIAIATVLLWQVTKALARETRQLAELSSRPHVVATIEPNRWSMAHADIKVDNTGTAPAYKIQVTFDPPLEGDDSTREKLVPLQNISVLKPGHGVSSYLSRFGPLLEKSYHVTISWCRDPSKIEREENRYTLNMKDFNGVTQLGAFDPLTQIASEMKKLRDDWQWVASGSRKIKTDVFTSDDRIRERKQLDEMHERMRNQGRPQAEKDSNEADQTNEDEQGGIS